MSEIKCRVGKYGLLNFDRLSNDEFDINKSLRRLDKRLRIRRCGQQYIVEIRWKTPKVLFKNKVLALSIGKYMEVLRRSYNDRRLINDLRKIDAWSPYYGTLLEQEIDKHNENLDEQRERLMSDSHLDAFNALLHPNYY